MITTRPTTQANSPPPNHTVFPSRFAIDDEVIFLPACQVLTASQGVVCKVVGVAFGDGKVLYDLALPAGLYEYYEAFPLMRVDSIFVFEKP